VAVIVERMYRFVTPVPRRKARGLNAAVYAQSAAELGAPFGPHLSPAPDLHAAAWAALRESQVAGRAPRAVKEAAAAAVAVANACPFCVDAHTALVHATGAHRLAAAVARGEAPPDPQDAALVAWAAATRAPGSATLRTAPFPAELAGEYVGTVLASHFVNRMMDALRPGPLLPVASRPARLLAGLLLSRTARRARRPGESLPLLSGLPAGEPPAWAGGGPAGPAFAALYRAADAGGALLDDPSTVHGVLSTWDGGHPPLAGGWLADAVSAAPPADRPGVRLALLAAAAPYRITDADVAAWHTARRGGDDADLVRLLAFGAMAAVRRLEAGIAGTQRGPLRVAQLQRQAADE
jgi:AhpD family alkylhydroperoxidase